MLVMVQAVHVMEIRGPHKMQMLNVSIVKSSDTIHATVQRETVSLEQSVEDVEEAVVEAAVVETVGVVRGTSVSMNYQLNVQKKSISKSSPVYLYTASK